MTTTKSRLKPYVPAKERYTIGMAVVNGSKVRLIATVGKTVEIAHKHPYSDEHMIEVLKLNNKRDAIELAEALVELADKLPEPEPKKPRKPKKAATKGRVTSAKALPVKRVGGAYEATDDDEF